jgi:hypothetical protein
MNETQPSTAQSSDAFPVAKQMLRPLTEVLVAGHILTADDVADVHEGIARRDTWITDYRAQIEVLERELHRNRVYLQDVLQALRVPLMGYGMQDGTLIGMFADRWVAPRLSVRILPKRPIFGVTLHGWAPERIPVGGRLRLTVGDHVASRDLMPGLFALTLSLPVETSDAVDVTVEATAWVEPDEADQRDRAFVMQAIEILHEPSCKSLDVI